MRGARSATGTEAQISTAYSYSDQLLTVWSKLGGEFAEWNEAKIHDLVRCKGITQVCYSEFEEYTKSELSRTIGVMIRMLQHYRAKWDAQWRGEAAERERRADERKRIVTEGIRWHEAEQYMVDNGITALEVYEVFRCIGDVDGVTYWTLRDQKCKFWTEKAAREFYRTHDCGGRPFDAVFEFVDEPGVHQALYRALFSIGVADRERDHE